MFRLAVGFMVGIVIGRWVGAWTGWAFTFFVAGCAVCAVGWWGSWRLCGNWQERMTGVMLVLMMVMLGGGWYVVRHVQMPSDDVGIYVGGADDGGWLVKVRGKVVGGVRETNPARGAFGKFTYRRPGSVFYLSVRELKRGDRFITTRGRLHCRVGGVMEGLADGDTVEVLGWLRAFHGARNPGEFDYAKYMTRKEVRGQLVVKSILHVEVAGQGGGLWERLMQMRRGAMARAQAALLAGFDQGWAKEIGLIQPIILGVWGDTDELMSDRFRRVGMSHVLSISGAHLGILLGVVWLVGRLFLTRPRWIIMLVVIVLGMYLLVLPMRVPIVRAGVMTLCFCVAGFCGWHVRGIAVLSFAAVLVLVGRPMELFEPGFQLSFGIVAALLLYTGGVSKRLLGMREDGLDVWRFRRGMGWMMWRRVVEYVAVSVVSFAVAWPIVAWHFEVVSPVAILMSVMAIPVLAMMLVLGFVKVAVGMVWVWAGSWMAWGLALSADLMLWVAAAGDMVWGGSVELLQKPSMGWVVTALICTVMMLEYVRRIRLWQLAVMMILLGGWLWIEQGGVPSLHSKSNTGGLSVHMISVGEGSCYVLQHGAETMMFDCGSQGYLDVGEKSILPAIQSLGVTRVDRLFLSHADLDHFSGVLDVMDGIAVGTVYVTETMLEEAEVQRREGRNQAVRFLMDELNRRDVVVEVIRRGDEILFGEGGRIEVLWPGERIVERKARNNGSMVLRVRYARRTVLLTGDLQEDGAEAMLAEEEIGTVDVMELPHHGGYGEVVERFVRMSQPRIVLQSCSETRLRHDRWAEVIHEMDAIQRGGGVVRYVSAVDGMSSVEIDANGGITSRCFVGGRVME